MARVLGQSMARIAEASRFLIGTTLLSPGSTEYDIARQGMYARPLVDLMEPTLAYVFGMQLMEQVRHEVFDRTARERGPLGARQVTICFADIVGWTELGEEAEEDTIGSVADRLAAMATDLLLPPVRVVKMIGDAAMLRLAGRRPAARVGAQPGRSSGGGQQLPRDAGRPRVGNGAQPLGRLVRAAGEPG